MLPIPLSPHRGMALESELAVVLAAAAPAPQLAIHKPLAVVADPVPLVAAGTVPTAAAAAPSVASPPSAVQKTPDLYARHPVVVLQPAAAVQPPVVPSLAEEAGTAFPYTEAAEHTLAAFGMLLVGLAHHMGLGMQGKQPEE